jgi:methyl-accepting chemotaxis protein
MASCGLVIASVVLVHLSGGFIEMHFHFFVAVTIIALSTVVPVSAHH